MSTVRQLDIISDTSLRRDYAGVLRIERQAASPASRQTDGRFTAAMSSKGVPDAVATVICSGYFDAVCRLMGLDRDAAMRQLARPSAGAVRVDIAWRRVAYARQLAMYLTSTEADIPQAQLGRVTGLDRAGVHKALRAVEDLRDRPDYEELIRCVLIDVAMNAGDRP